MLISFASNNGLTFYRVSCKHKFALAAKKMLRYSAHMENKPAHIALADHIRARGMKKQDFAKLVGVRNDHLSRWLAGKVRPERSARMLIALVTDGAVPTEAWE
jgi:DNA-binding transcriptional regulator YiaG